MAKNIENFRDELTKLAQVAEILEKSFLSKGEIKVEVSLDNDTFSNLLKDDSPTYIAIEIPIIRSSC